MFINIDVKLLSIFKFANHRTKEPLVSPTNKVGTLIAIGDAINISAIITKKSPFLKCLFSSDVFVAVAVVAA